MRLQAWNQRLWVVWGIPKRALNNGSELTHSPNEVEFELGARNLSAPAFFPSVSSVKASLLPVEEVELLSALMADHLLISAYDYAHSDASDLSAMAYAVQKVRANGSVVLLDSGNYEGYWHRDLTWTRDQFHTAALALPCDAVFTYDEHFAGGASDIVNSIVAGANADSRALPDVFLIPIVHVSRTDSDKATAVLTGVARELSLRLMAVPERELGDGIFARSHRIRAIRNALLDAGLDTSLHILGTGNPLSLLAYSAAGADSFDGLEWCHTIVDHTTALLFHFQQYDLFRDQTRYGDGALPFAVAGRAHNLAFLGEWMRILREGRKLGDYEPTFLSEHVGKRKVSPATPPLQELLASLSYRGSSES